ncbi:MAG: hypothetical protein ACI8W0_001736, partial [Flavobacterium sp.]
LITIESVRSYFRLSITSFQASMYFINGKGASKVTFIARETQWG